MKITIVNQGDIPADLPEGRYCCHLISATWAELRVEFTRTRHKRDSGCCLFQLVKHAPLCDCMHRRDDHLDAITPAQASSSHQVPSVYTAPSPCVKCSCQEYVAQEQVPLSTLLENT